MPNESEKAIRVYAERVSRELESRAAEAQARDERFEHLDEQTLTRRLAGGATNIPIPAIGGVGLSPYPVARGGTLTVSVLSGNPDPQNYPEGLLYVYLSFGTANTIQSVDLSLTAMDTRFPRLRTRRANGTFTITIPSDIDPGVYFGNLDLVELGFFTVGRVFDRTNFALDVV